MHDTIIAFDFGLRRIGVATGQRVTGSASPLRAIRNGENGPDFDAIDQLISEWQPDLLVVGMPLSADGGPTEMADNVARFVAALDRYDLPVVTVDERHTSAEASRLLIEARSRGSRGRLRKEDVDSAAAVVIAERWLSSANIEHSTPQIS